MSTGIAEEEGAGEGWTDEKHTSFLNWMEDSFVTCMLLGGRFAYATGDSRRVAAPPPPLDRYLPDGADSTLDHPTDKRARRTAAQPPREGRRGFEEGLRRTRRRLQRRPAQGDQVVPEFEAKEGGENARPLYNPEIVRPAATDDHQLPAE